MMSGPQLRADMAGVGPSQAVLDKLLTVAWMEAFASGL